jgi:hypothetical protein
VELPTIGIDAAKDALDVSVVTGGKAIGNSLPIASRGLPR